MARRKKRRSALDGFRVTRTPRRKLQVVREGRKLFDAERKRVFLEWMSVTNNLSLSAREAGIHYRTALRHRAKGAAFRADLGEAAGQGSVRVGCWLGGARDDGSTDYDPAAHAPANLTPDQAMQLLRDQAQRDAAAAKAAAQVAGGGGGGGVGRRPSVAPMDVVRAQVVRGLVALGQRLSAAEAGEEAFLGDGDEREGEGIGPV